jgi:hypothetical protein
VLHFQYSCDILGTILDEIKEKRPVSEWLYNRWFLIFTPALVLDFPLIFIRAIRSFSRVSLATAFLICLYLLHSAVSLAMGVHEHGFDPDHAITYFSFNKLFIQAVAIQAFGYHCHPLVGPTIAQLANPTRERQYILMGFVVIVAAFCYLMSGLLPYLTLFDHIDNVVIFSCYPTGQVITIITKGVYALFLLITVPLLLYTSRLAFTGMMTCLCKVEVTPVIWDIVGIVLLGLAALLAVAVINIPLMFDFIGGVAIPIIVYILPAVYYVRLCDGDNRAKKLMAWVMIPIGIATIAVCLYDSISRLAGNGSN